MKFKNAVKIERLRLIDKDLKRQKRIIKGRIAETRGQIKALESKGGQTHEDVDRLNNLKGQVEAMGIHQAVLLNLAIIEPEAE